MNRRRNYAIGVISFGAKGAFAFAITYWVANYFAPTDLALWATFFSLGSILSVADLGVGQLILTSVHEKLIDSEGEQRLISNAIAALLVLGILMFVATSATLSARHLLEEIRWKDLTIAIILLRLAFVPHGAFLMALERYHERKLVEAVSYAAAAAFVLWAIRSGINVSAMLLWMNAILTAASLALYARAKQLGMHAARASDVSVAALTDVVAGSFPYFVYSVSGLAIYGGFIAMSALVMTPVELARLALLHTVLFMHVYQIFELVFRSVQPRMRDADIMRKVRFLVVASLGVGLALSLTIGSRLATLVFRKYEYSAFELAFYTVFLFFEIYYQMIASRIQMRSAMSGTLKWLSVAKALGFALILGIAWAAAGSMPLSTYILMLVAYSAVMTMIAAMYSRDSGVPLVHAMDSRV